VPLSEESKARLMLCKLSGLHNPEVESIWKMKCPECKIWYRSHAGRFLQLLKKF